MTFFPTSNLSPFTIIPPFFPEERKSIKPTNGAKIPDNMFLMFPLLDLRMYYTTSVKRENIFILGNALMDATERVLLEVIYI